MPQLKYWNGSAWVNASIGVQGVAGLSGTQGTQGTTGTQGNTGGTGATGFRAGYPYTFSTTTTKADPGAGVFRFNNATQSNVTEIYIDDSTNGADDVRQALITLNSGTGPVKSFLNIFGSTEQLNFQVNSITQETGYLTLGVTYLSGGADPLDSSESSFLQFYPVGIQGTQGIQGTIGNSNGVAYTFSTTTTDADPGAGFYRFNSGTLGSITTMYISKTDNAAQNQSAWIASWDDSTNTSNEGYLYINTRDISNDIARIFKVTGSVTDAGNYHQVPVLFVSGSSVGPGNNATPMVISFSPSGDIGVQGTTGLQGTTGTQGTVGTQGTIGTQGLLGIQGIQGITGASGTSSSIFDYVARANSQTPPPNNGQIMWSNSTQINSTNIYVSHIDDRNQDLDFLLSNIKDNDIFFIQDRNNSNNYQKWEVSGTPSSVTHSYFSYPVILLESGGTGTTNFNNTHQLALITQSVGVQGTTGTQGLLGLQGTQGIQGIQGLQGPGTFYTYSATPPSSPAVGDRWVDSNDGVSYTYTYDGNSSAWVELNAIGYAGLQGVPGPQGITGIGAQGLQGSLGTQGIIGIQGPVGSAVYDLDQAVISMQVFR